MGAALEQANPVQPSAWTLRDEFAMYAMAAMVIKGGWGTTSDDGVHRAYRNMAEYAKAAYAFADHMLAARVA